MYNNILSYFFAILSWFLVVIALKGGIKNTKPNLFIMGSLIMCSFTLLFQIAEIHRRIVIGDISALMDTSYAILFICGAYLLFTIILNIIAYKIINNKK